ncbi:TetR/AcrR family transcriptional regulator [Nocardia farcinica]|uniref:TetR/AcrR family transcriptional regulator n=1 Tax=Nocardia farcinica TaxID=37329 RepID=UPI0018942774|nr:TetR/AcrR family transcriptional regulator [Nocardia farcinica]MBF6068787.1 TetR/AcrR family transcriptional regulator [Nocardia farcinica]MBF6266650.1 TetR/AcrR family transcriptional regulator [Nocardia farcinica]MBF6291530.1 TetR/AcrR family transcriptional regulator [Nocardia farcinica]MBF6373205.1 TetR/AcrR family transcriptional regulator [Nocardia farcinica]MBF6378179.1 TetR/AcrR family transcriptional regulator [Nocardia farcinica]
MAGRAREERIDRAVLAAARDLLDQHGYADVSIGQVAARAGVHRPAVYRRWPSKRHLVVDVVADVLGTEPTPDTGDLRADLTAALRALVAALRDTSLHRVLPALVADLAADPELHRHFLGAVFEPRRESTAAALASARARQEIRPGIDLDFVLDAIAAPIYYRALFGHLPLDDALVEQSVDAVLRAIRA